MLDAPEFFFELETKRIAADLHPEFKAIVPPGTVGQKDYAQQTNDADASDFEEALKTGALQPPDPQQARAAHLAAIKLLERKEQQTEHETAAREEAIASDVLPSSSAAPPSPSAAPSATAAAAPSFPDEFPSEFAQYHHGAFAYRSGETTEMQSAWNALLTRPAPERKYRTTWTEYMLGKAALENMAAAEARAHFQKTREAAKTGFVDSLGLAAASLGWEAMIELGAEHYPEAARLYLEQLATGDVTAVNSLRALMDQLVGRQSDLTPLMGDPLMQRLATAMRLSGMGIFGGYEMADDQTSPSHRWLELLEQADAKQVKDADCVAWMYYQKGDYKAAERWLKIAVADSGYSLWLKAKLALRDGKLDVATQLLARAMPKLPPAQELESRYTSYEMLPADTSKGDLGLLRIGRAEFVAAAKLFVQVSKSDDAEYVAEAVLTLPELMTFIEKELPEQPKTDRPENEPPPADWRETFRAIVGRRLARAGKFAEARPNFPEATQAVLDEYVPLLTSGNDARRGKAERAEALWKAAELIEEKGEPLFDYALPAAMAARLAGRTVAEPDYPEVAITYREPEKLVPPVTAAERTRLRQNIVPAVHRRHSIYVAAELGWRAAALLPDNDDHTADVLNTAGSWLKNRDEKAADRFYQAIERRCARTELGKEAIKHHWFVPTSRSDEESDSSADDPPEPAG